MRDFTLNVYQVFLTKLREKGYVLLPYKEYIENNHAMPDFKSSIAVLRHDVDLLPEFALIQAKVEHDLGIHGTYYFRTVEKTFNIELIRKIDSMGHEIGYHYEDIDLVLRSLKIKKQKLTREEIIDRAYESFCKNLETFRSYIDIKTICMHGSPLSKYDNKLIWTKYDYKELNILAEPYFDINWDKFGYLTDTGRRWNGQSVSIRDKVSSKFEFNFKRTTDIISNINSLPEKMMFTIHPQRWTNNFVPWMKELIIQNFKNGIKRFIVK